MRDFLICFEKIMHDSQKGLLHTKNNGKIRDTFFHVVRQSFLMLDICDKSKNYCDVAVLR